jgi:hypothetical protein
VVRAVWVARVAIEAEAWAAATASATNGCRTIPAETAEAHLADRARAEAERGPASRAALPAWEAHVVEVRAAVAVAVVVVVGGGGRPCES